VLPFTISLGKAPLGHDPLMGPSTPPQSQGRAGVLHTPQTDIVYIYMPVSSGSIRGNFESVPILKFLHGCVGSIVCRSSDF
jgi:hypothetical protein